MKSIYILLSMTETGVSKFLSFMTKDELMHSSISFDTKLEELYSFGRKYDNFPLPGGCKIEDIRSGIFLKNCNMLCALYKLDVEDSIYEKAKNLCETMYLNKEKYKYNLVGVCTAYFDIPYKSKDKYFCSEFVGYVLQESGAVKIDKNLGLLHPVDFANLDEVELIYKGSLKELIEKIEKYK